MTNRFTKWFSERRYPSSYFHYNAFLMNSLYLAIAIILTLIAYKNISVFNEYVLIFIQIGSVALCIGTFFILKYIYKIIKNLKYGFHGLTNGYKLIIVIIVLLLAIGFYHRQEQYIPTIKENINSINFTYYNPIYLSPSSATKENIQSDSITGHLSAQSSDELPESPSISFIESLMPSSEPISEKTKQIERLVFELTNKERQKQNKRPLQWDERLSSVARDHSLDMANNYFFSHTNLQGEDPTARAKRHNYNVHKELGNGWYSDGIAENINKMPTGNVLGVGYISNTPESIAEAQVSSWMNSPGHRANILQDDYDLIGVGVAYDGQYYISTQNFK